MYALFYKNEATKWCVRAEGWDLTSNQGTQAEDRGNDVGARIPTDRRSLQACDLPGPDLDQINRYSKLRLGVNRYGK